ncbi:MAG: FG-GAP repeat protein, partial [Gammaproteobacteria bacterium]|nr:FG-GAP repeat protein [Gammaproteobacteria bacterium]
MNNLILALLTSVIMMAVLSACSNGGGTNPQVTSYELLDPTFAAGNKFGTSVAILPNGNIIVSAPYDSTYAVNGGAVHLFNPYAQIL